MDYKSVAGMFQSQAEKHGAREFIRHKVGGAWRGVSWSELAERARAVAVGLLRLGLQPGGAVCVLSENRLEWILTDLGIISAGGITAGIYASNVPRDVAYIISHSESRFVFVENKKQLDKVLEMISELPLLEKIIVYDTAGCEVGGMILGFAGFLEQGENAVAEHLKELESRMESVRPDDVATYIYTSGTTGPPKAAMLTHGNIIFICQTTHELGLVTEQDETLSFLPLAHAFERVVFYISLLAAGRIWMAESLAKLMDNFPEARPTVVTTVPRMFEKIYDGIQLRVAKMSPFNRFMFNWAVGVGKEFVSFKVKNETPPLMLSVKHAIADRLVFRKLHSVVGGRLRCFLTGGAPMSPELCEFYHAIGLPVYVAYGMTETCAPATVNLPGDVRFDSVGKPLKGIDVAIAEDCEILMRGPSIFKGYFKDPENTERTLRDGWCHSGDLGCLAPDGHLKITGRKKDLIITAGGKNIAPMNLEFHFLQNRYLNQMVVAGEAKPYLVAMLTLNQEEIARYAAERGIATSDGEPLDLHPKIVQMIGDVIAERNSYLARFEQIKKFRILPGEFTIESGEMTPTLKIKRNVVFTRYREMIEEMYEDGKK